MKTGPNLPVFLPIFAQVGQFYNCHPHRTKITNPCLELNIPYSVGRRREPKQFYPILDISHKHRTLLLDIFTLNTLEVLEEKEEDIKMQLLNLEKIFHVMNYVVLGR